MLLRARYGPDESPEFHSCTGVCENAPWAGLPLFTMCAAGDRALCFGIGLSTTIQLHPLKQKLYTSPVSSASIYLHVQVVSQLPHRPSMQPIRTGSSGGEQKRPQLPCTASTQHLYGETSVEEMPDQWSVHRGGHRRLCSQQEALDSLQLVAKQWSPVSTSRCGP